MKKASKLEELGRLADQIEAELRLVGWDPNPPSEEEVLSGGAFGYLKFAFETWLQVVFIRRLRQVAAGEIAMPRRSSVGVHAARQWDGVPDRDRLLGLIAEADRIVEQ